MHRRQFFLGASASVLAACGGPNGTSRPAKPLRLIPQVDLTRDVETRISLALQKSRHDFGTGVLSETFGINGSYLGPLLRVKQGQTLPVDVTNKIGEVTTIHWHGLHIPGDVDGGPHQEIAPGQTWSPDVPIVQHASMNWFHSHMHGKTARQTHMGLAGILLVEDDASLSADLPQTYGVDDFTLVLQDKVFGADGKMTYFLSGEVFEDGFEGDTLVINGALAPAMQTVPTGLVRLRILNACNAYFLRLSMETGPITVIASDGGFLSAPVETDDILMSPGERYEILVDMATYAQNGLNVVLDGNNVGLLSSILGTNQPERALTLMQSDAKGFSGSMPTRLANLEPADASGASKTRSFSLEMETGADLDALAAVWGNFCGDAGSMAINGQPMRMDRIDERVTKGDTEIWRVQVDDMLHPFHIHGCSFRILKQNGSTPPAYARGWKDMVHVQNGWSEVLVRFDHEAPESAPYMYHCHILEHEDCGMMGQFTVT